MPKDKKADFKNPQVFKFGDEEYEVYPSQAVAASKIIAKMHEKLGKPDTPLSDTGEKLMEVIIAVWEDSYPKQAKDWYAMRKNYKREEMSTKEQVTKKTGRSLASVPTPIYKMMRKVFPEFRLNDRDKFMKLVDRYPIFQMANKR